MVLNDLEVLKVLGEEFLSNVYVM